MTHGPVPVGGPLSTLRSVLETDVVRVYVSQTMEESVEDSLLI